MLLLHYFTLWNETTLHNTQLYDWCMTCNCIMCILNLSQFGPVVCSLQFKHSPVSSSHTSDSPLHSQCRQNGKPQNPVWQRSQRRPVTSERHAHWPLIWSHSSDIEPRGSHSHAVNNQQEKKSSWTDFNSFVLKKFLLNRVFGLISF